jgi:uncharacterized protein YjbJ (UPF0337 family)
MNSKGGEPLNKDQMAGKWHQLKGSIKKEWGKLTDNDLDQVEGNYETLVGKIQEKYGTSREEIERRLKGLD